MDPPVSLEDAKRKQFMAEGLVDLMRTSYREQSDDTENILIGITDKDVYAREFDWPYTFNYRHKDRFGIISLARLDPAFFNRAPDPEILSSRLKKVTTKLLGLMYYRLQAGPLPFSVLGSQASLEEIDRAGQDILASDVPESEGGEPCLTFTFDSERSYHTTKLINSCADNHFFETRRNVVELGLRQGLILIRANDFIESGAPRIVLSRVYRNQDPYHHAFGIGSNHPYDDFLYSRDGMTTVTVNLEGGSAAKFDRTTAGTGFNPDVQFVNRGNGGDFSQGQIYWKDSHFHVSTSFGATYSFQPCIDNGVPCYMSGYRDSAGDELKFHREANGELLKLEMVPEPSSGLSGTTLDFKYNPQHSITEIHTNTGETANYDYDDDQRLIRAQNTANQVTQYAYDAKNNLTEVREENRTVLRANSDDKDTLAHLELWDASYDISYVLDERGNIVEADLAVSDGSTIKVYMLNGHYSVARVDARTPSEAPRTTY